MKPRRIRVTVDLVVDADKWAIDLPARASFALERRAVAGKVAGYLIGLLEDSDAHLDGRIDSIVFGFSGAAIHLPDRTE